MKKDFRIIFIGTPDFAVETLKILYENNYNIIGVVTVPDKTSGRGKKIKPSAVKKYAESKKLNILQPTNLKDNNFIAQLKELNADISIVVAFRMLPKVVWQLAKIGCINVHASLLPNYRGAAPINHVIINGETKTGVTTFFINKNIDTGEIIFRDIVEIKPDETAGELHNKLMYKGAELALKTVKAIENNKYSSIIQNKLLDEFDEIKTAPKIFKEDCRIKWDNTINNVYNMIRGLSPYPGAYTYIYNTDGKKLQLKIFKTTKTNIKSTEKGQIISDNKSFIYISTADYLLQIDVLQLEGRTKMTVFDFLRGINDINSWHLFNIKL